MDHLVLNLQLFDGAAGAGAAGTGAGAGAPTQEGQPHSPAKGKNALGNVAYGKQAAPEPPEGMEESKPRAESETQITTDTAEEKRAAFEQLIKGDYKDSFNERVQQIINARFKETKGLETRLNAMQPMFDALSAKYGVKPDDAEALMKAIEEDDSYYEDEAERRGLTVEQFKTFKRMERENEQFRNAQEEAARREQSNRLYAKWQDEAENCAKLYPGFDLQKECRAETGERFLSLLQNGVDVQTAYELIHKDELLGGAIQYAVANTQKRTMDSIRARGMRPGENGSGGIAPGQIAKRDVTKLTRADRDEIGRRVLRGERIEF